jgi:CRP-like cAMP-binding protein
MADFLDEKLKEIQSRLRELRPLVDEFRRLEKAEQALSGVGPSRPAAATPRRSRARASAPSNGRRGRPRGTGTRANQALDLVRARPGITIPELAEAMDIKQNYLYRVMPGLAEQGLVAKSGRGWHARGDGNAKAPDAAGAEEPVAAEA